MNIPFIVKKVKDKLSVTSHKLSTYHTIIRDDVEGFRTDDEFVNNSDFIKDLDVKIQSLINLAKKEGAVKFIVPESLIYRNHN